MPAGQSYDGRTRFIWLANDPADPAEPTLAEVDAGVDLSGYLIPESFNPTADQARVDGRDALSSFNPEAMGRYGYKPTAEFKTKLRETFNGDDDLAWQTFKNRLTQGCILFFEGVDEGEDVGVGDVCDVYLSCETGTPRRLQTAINTERRFGVDFAVGAPPVLGAIVVAS